MSLAYDAYFTISRRLLRDRIAAIIQRVSNKQVTNTLTPRTFYDFDAHIEYG